MAFGYTPHLLRRGKELAVGFRRGWRLVCTHGPNAFQFWLIALVIGICAGFAAVWFRRCIAALQSWLYGTDDVQMLHSFADTLPWYLILTIPVAGGLVVGQILHRFTPDGRVRSVADAIEGAALNDGRVETREGVGFGAGLLYHAVFGRVFRSRRTRRPHGGRDFHLDQRPAQG